VAAKAKPFTGVRPERYVRNGWQPCEPFQCQQWAAVLDGVVVHRYLHKAAAERELASACLRKSGPTRRYRLGTRMPPAAKPQKEPKQ
jgi:hypothetical protein